MFDPQSCTETTRRILVAAQQAAVSRGHAQITPAHLLHAAIEEPDGLAKRIIAKAGAKPEALAEAVAKLLRDLPRVDPAPAQPALADAAARVLTAAQAEQQRRGDAHLAADVLLIALARDKDLARICDAKAVSGAVDQLRQGRTADSDQAESRLDALAKYGRDLVAAARAGKLDPVIGRDDEIRRVVRVLSRRTKNNPVLIGEPGVGKTAIAEGLAARIVAGDVPETLRDRSVVALDLGALVAGAKYRGEFEERLKGVLDEVKNSDGRIVLFIDEMHTLMGAGRTDGAMDAANLLKPLLARGELRCIGATTLDEYRKHVEKDAAFERRFQPVQVGEPSVEDTVSILRGLKGRYEAHHGVRIADAALVAAARLSSRYIQDRFLPDKAIDLVDEACASARVQLDSRPEAIDHLDRRRLQLDVEATALAKEEDPASRERLERVRGELTTVREQLASLTSRHDAEKQVLDRQRETRRKLEEAKAAMEAAKRKYDLGKVAELQYGVIPDLERILAEAPPERTLLSESVGPEQVAEVVSRWTGIPAQKLTEGDRERLLQLGQRLGNRVVGQDEAVEAVADAVLRARAGLSDAGLPLGVFLFLGPTGVGKTELAKALAHELFDDEKHLVRIDMSEYMEPHSVSRLIGAPPGYVGHDEGGQLTEAVRRRPYTVVLLDEVEKAHPQVWNTMLQVFDDGRLTDGQGRTVSFANTVIIMTSNLGSDALLAGVTASGELREGTREEVMQAVRGHFRPEFLNRLTDTVLFSPLTRVHLRRIVQLQIDRIAARLKERRITLELTDAGLDRVIAEGYDPQYGARPLRRYLERQVSNALARRLLDGSVADGARLRIEPATPEGLALIA